MPQGVVFDPLFFKSDIQFPKLIVLFLSLSNQFNLKYIVVPFQLSAVKEQCSSDVCRYSLAQKSHGVLHSCKVYGIDARVT